MRNATWPRRAGLAIQALLLHGYLLTLTLPANAQQAVTITNTANAIFRPTPTAPPQPVPSNPTTVVANQGQPVLELIKTGDRAAAEPGDTVIYRLLVRNSGTATVNNVSVTDKLPLGLQFVPSSLQGSFTSETGTVPVTLTPGPVTDGNITFNSTVSLAPGQVLNIVYAALLTPDSVRGSGRNLAVSAGLSGGQPIQSNQASHLLRIRPGILSDCGTLIGRVFVDKNFDGEQQPGEPGVPNAVVFLDDGNRITTDEEGLFSVANVISGYRSGVLDLTSIPDYTLAPNRVRIEGNSQSRLVRLEPGGLVRMNFAVTPAAGEE